MSHIQLNPLLLENLRGKVAVVTGGATGIGRETVRLFCQHGANVVFGDVSSQPAKELEEELGSSSIRFVHCDVTSYSSQLQLFAFAEKAFGNVDIVVANAGIGVHRDPFAPDADIEVEPSTREIDINLKGAIFTSRIGMHYLRKDGGGDLVLVSSIAGFKESTGLVTYTASKHGVVGILRGLRVQAAREGVRLNCVCPWFTKTAMVAGIEKGWRELKLPENTAADVAKSIAICATANLGNETLRHQGSTLPFQGNVVFAAGGESYEIEEKFNELESEWLGKENSRVLKIGQDYLMNGETSWDVGKQASNS